MTAIVIPFPGRSMREWLKRNLAAARDQRRAAAFSTALDWLDGGNIARAASAVPRRDRAVAELFAERLLEVRRARRGPERRRRAA